MCRIMNRSLVEMVAHHSSACSALGLRDHLHQQLLHTFSTAASISFFLKRHVRLQRQQIGKQALRLHDFRHVQPYSSFLVRRLRVVHEVCDHCVFL